jgi:magnesium and cobalt exporter, CNNM family
MSNEIIIGVVAVLLSILGTAIINSVEIAVISVNRISVHHLADEGSRSAQALERLHQEQEQFFAVVVILQTFLVVLAGVVGGQTAEKASGSIWAIIGATFLTAYITAQFGDLTPKVLGARASESYALAVALPTEALMRLMRPLGSALAFLPNVLSRVLLGVNLNNGPRVSEAELRMLIDMSAESGTMEEAEAELLDRVFHFGDRHVHEVMTPRTEAVGVESHAVLGDFLAIYKEAHHSRFPVYDESLDSVVGILVIKDVLSALASGDINLDGPVEPLVRQALFVPETKLIGELFREMQARGDQMAIAVDEFGGTAGIVTLEQLLEEMVGQVRDEMWAADTEITKIDEHTSQIDGSLSIEEAREELDLNIPEGDYDTVAGYVLSLLGHIPKVGETVALDGYRITVAEMRGLKIEQLRVVKA